MAARFVDDLAERFLTMAMELDQALIRFAFLDCVEIGTLDILDQRNFERDAVIEFANDCGDLMQMRPLCCPPAPFARDNTEFIADRPHNDRLQHTAHRD